MAKKILEDNEVLVAAAVEPEVLAGADETQPETTPEVVDETPAIENEPEVLTDEGETTQTSTLPPDETKVVSPVEPKIPAKPTIPATSSIVSPTIPNIPSDGNKFDEAEQQRLRLLGYI